MRASGISFRKRWVSVWCLLSRSFSRSERGPSLEAILQMFNDSTLEDCP